MLAGEDCRLVDTDEGGTCHCTCAHACEKLREGCTGAGVWLEDTCECLYPCEEITHEDEKKCSTYGRVYADPCVWLSVYDQQTREPWCGCNCDNDCDKYSYMCNGGYAKHDKATGNCFCVCDNLPKTDALGRPIVRDAYCKAWGRGQPPSNPGDPIGQLVDDDPTVTNNPAGPWTRG